MSSYSWTIPAAPSAGSSGAGNTEQAFDARVSLGRDLFWEGGLRVSPRGDWLTVDGIAALRQSILRRLITSPGEWAVRPTYGVGALDFVYETLTTARAAELRNRIRDQLTQDPRIQKANVVEVEQTAAGILRIRVQIVVKGTIVALKPFLLPEDATP